MIPKIVNICGIPHEVELCGDDFGTGRNFGFITYATCKIRINKDMPEPMIKESLCHEIVHGMLTHLGYDDQSNDEQFVQALAMAINMTFEVKDEYVAVCAPEKETGR